MIDVQRFAPFELRASEGTDGFTLEGYAAVFNSDTVIDSWEGVFTERIAPGAFAKTLKERTPVLQFDHGTHPLIGSIPLGSIRALREDDHGLFVSARLSDNWLIEPVRVAISDGAVNGMSFLFQVVKDAWNEDRSERTVREVVLHELGPVVFPAYSDTAVGVRSMADNGLPELVEARMTSRLAGTDNERTPDPVEERQGEAPGTTDQGAAAQPEPPPQHSGMSTNARERALTLLNLNKD